MSATRAARPTLLLVTDRKLAGDGLLPAVEAAVAGGVDRVQIRERALGGAALCEHVEAIRAAAERGARARGGEVAIDVNRFIDVALACGAAGVHLGFDAVAPESARDLLPAHVRISLACHSVGEVREASRRPVDVVQLAPVFAPLSKASERPALGTEALSEATRHPSGPAVIAQGGIDPDTGAACVEAGAAGVAVTGHVLLAANPHAAAQELRLALDRAAAS